MALGDVYIFDNARVEVTANFYAANPSWTNISDSVGMAKVMIEHPVAEGRHTFGRRGMRRRSSRKYTWSVDLGFCIDGFDAATTLDGIMQTLMSEPMGSSSVKRPGIRITGNDDGLSVVTGIIVTNGGTSYTSAPTVTVDAPGTGTTATATAVLDGNSVETVTVGTAGTGYDITSPPDITFSGGAGSGAAAFAVLGSGDGNPQFTGELVIHEWEPFGSGAVNEAIEEDRTFNGSGNLHRSP